MNHGEWLARAETYALGALDGEELRQFEAHLASGCPSCERHITETRETLTLLPRSLEPIDPPPGVRARLLNQIVAERARPGGRRQGPLWWGMGVGAAVAAGLLIALGWNLSATRQEMERLQARVAALRAEVAQKEETLRLLADPGVRLVSLAGLAASPGASGRLLWNPVTRTGLLVTAGLPPVPPGRAYELWAIAGKEPVPAGVFTVEPGGRALLRLPPLPEAKAYEKFAVTLEPAGGVQTPTGPMHLLGSL